MEQLIKLLHESECSCVLETVTGSIITFNRRGVIDLYTTLTQKSQILSNARIADKVVGRGAAALMILGQIRCVYADVISSAALDLLNKSKVEVSFAVKVDKIMNRAGDDICPVEKLTESVETAQEAFPLIADFIKKMINNNQQTTDIKCQL